MNVKELIEKYKRYEGKWNGKTGELARQIFLEDLKQLDEPRKVKVKKFVADWYEEHKDEFEYNVWDWLSSKSESGKIDSKFAFWLNDVDNTPIQTLVNMHQFGYEVDEERKWVVKVGNLYFCGWEDTTAQFVMNTVLGEDESIIKYKNEGTASSVAKNLGGTVEKV